MKNMPFIILWAMIVLGIGLAIGLNVGNPNQSRINKISEKRQDLMRGMGDCITQSDSLLVEEKNIIYPADTIRDYQDGLVATYHMNPRHWDMERVGQIRRGEIIIDSSVFDMDDLWYNRVEMMRLFNPTQSKPKDFLDDDWGAYNWLKYVDSIVGDSVFISRPIVIIAGQRFSLWNWKTGRPFKMICFDTMRTDSLYALMENSILMHGWDSGYESPKNMVLTNDHDYEDGIKPKEIKRRDK